MDRIQEYNEGNLFGKENNLELKIISDGKIEYWMKIKYILVLSE